MDEQSVESTPGPARIYPRLPPRDRQGGGKGRGSSRRRRDSRSYRPDPETACRDLGAEIERGNALLAKAGSRVRLELVPGTDGSPDRVAVCYPTGGDRDGERCVSRTVRRREFQQWLARLENLEGLVIDTQR